MELFGPHVELATQIMDADGAWVVMPWPGSYMEQPETDMTILSIIRGRWNELRKAEFSHG